MSDEIKQNPEGKSHKELRKDLQQVKRIRSGNY